MGHDILHGIVIEESEALSLSELCRICNVEVEWIIALVNEGILEPAGTRPEDWFFSGIVLQRVLVVRRLQRDLDINLAGAALVLELLEERNASFVKTNFY
ncbi:chaperone modulator CbpM [Nitrosomonas sp.]|uniref:chaperone modulator CbpM n=1 Tax=Nitrosomonas sp. TaxID=42353 RepID=UPI0033061A60